MPLKAIVSMLVLSAALAACGGSDHPAPPPGPGGVAAPPPAPSVQINAHTRGGGVVNLKVQCGPDSSIKDCGDVTESLMDKLSKMKPDSGQQQQ